MLSFEILRRTASPALDAPAVGFWIVRKPRRRPTSDLHFACNREQWVAPKDILLDERGNRGVGAVL